MTTERKTAPLGGLTSRRTFIAGAAGGAAIVAIVPGGAANASTARDPDLASEAKAMNASSIRSVNWLSADGLTRIQLDVPAVVEFSWPRSWSRSASISIVADRRVLEIGEIATLSGAEWEEEVRLELTSLDERRTQAVATFSFPDQQSGTATLSFSVVTKNPYPFDLFDDGEPFSLTIVEGDGQGRVQSLVASPALAEAVHAWGVELFPSFVDVDEKGYRAPFSCLVRSVGPQSSPAGVHIVVGADSRKVSTIALGSVALNGSESALWSSASDVIGAERSLMIELPPLGPGESASFQMVAAVAEGRIRADLSSPFVFLSSEATPGSYRRPTGRYSVADVTPSGNDVTEG